MTDEPLPLRPPDRLLCGPGPSNVEPSVLDAMRKPMLGHLDPDFHDILLEVVAMLRRATRRSLRGRASSALALRRSPGGTASR